MPDQYYADPTRVTLGEDFSTDFRYLREAIATSLVTYLQAGPTLATADVLGNTNAAKDWAYSCGPYQARVSASSGFTMSYPTNTVKNIAL